MKDILEINSLFQVLRSGVLNGGKVLSRILYGPVDVLEGLKRFRWNFFEILWEHQVSVAGGSIFVGWAVQKISQFLGKYRKRNRGI